MRILTFIFLFLFMFGAAAQTGKVLDAYNSVAAKDFEKARTLIDEAAKDEASKNDPQYYFWRGFIYKELYKETEKGKNRESQLRDESAEALYTLMEMRSKVSPDTIKLALNVLNYLSQTYFNDAVTSLDTTNYKIAISNYDKYSKVSKAVDPSVDLSERDIKFKTKLATLYVDLYEVRSNKEEGDEFFEKAKNEYSEIIRIDQNNLTANYNLGIHFYNKAVNIIKNLDVETSLEELARKEDVCVDLFLKALPYVKTAYELDPSRKETLIGLTGIYWSLNDQEKYQYYEQKLKELQ